MIGRSSQSLHHPVSQRFTEYWAVVIGGGEHCRMEESEACKRVEGRAAIRQLILLVALGRGKGKRRGRMKIPP